MYNEFIVQDTTSKAKSYEANFCWAHAAACWNKIGRDEDRDACLLLLSSEQQGDRYRELIGPEPDKTTDAHAWVKWFDNLSICRDKVFEEFSEK